MSGLDLLLCHQACKNDLTSQCPHNAHRGTERLHAIVDTRLRSLHALAVRRALEAALQSCQCASALQCAAAWQTYACPA